MKFENKWNGRRLGSFNVEPYLKSIYGENITVKKVSSFKLYDVKPLLQNDYGDDFDCSITSITTCILKYAPFLKDTDVYKAVENLKVGDTIDCDGYLYWYNDRVHLW